MGFLSDQNANWIVTLETIVDATFLVDIIMNFHFAYYDHKFEIVDDKAVRTWLYFPGNQEKLPQNLVRGRPPRHHSLRADNSPLLRQLFP